MKNFFVIMLLALSFFHSTSAMNDAEARASFEKVLSGDEEVNILLISRNNGSYEDVQANEEQDDYGDIGNTDLNTIFQNIKGHLSKTNWNIVVFNEMFFSKITPLSKARMEEIKKLFFDVIKSDPELFRKTILVSNFLYTKEIPYDIKIIENAENNMETDNVEIGTMTTAFLQTYKTWLSSLKAVSPPPNLHVLYNRSFISYNYEDVAYYDKSSYCNESNDAIFGKGAYTGKSHVYMVGDSKDHRNGSENYSLLEDLLIKNVSSEVCYDLLVGVRKKNNWINETDGTKLHILTSNSVDAKGNENFPNDKTVICVDPDGTPFTRGPSLTEVFSKQDDKFNVNKKDVERFYYGNSIKGNRYYLTISLIRI